VVDRGWERWVEGVPESSSADLRETMDVASAYVVAGVVSWANYSDAMNLRMVRGGEVGPRWQPVLWDADGIFRVPLGFHLLSALR